MRVTLPSERNFEIYHAAVTEQMARRDVAARFGLSLTRVQQIVTQVEHFVREHGHERLRCDSPERLELSSLRLCYDQVDHFQKMVMRSYHALNEQGASVVAQCRLLQTATRLCIDLTRVAGRIAKAQCAMLEAGTINRTEVERVEFELSPEDRGEEPAIAGATVATALSVTPQKSELPVGGCTPHDTKTVKALAAALDFNSTNIDDRTICDALTAGLMRRRDAKARSETPVQKRSMAAGNR